MKAYPVDDMDAVIRRITESVIASVTAKHATSEPEPEPKTEPKAKLTRTRTATASKSKLTARSQWYDVLPAILPHTNRILLIGPPSSGKSTTAQRVAKIRHRVTMTETTSTETLIGTFLNVEGNTVWHDGPFTRAMRAGEAILVDEVDRYSPEAASLFYSLIDDGPHIILPNGETVEAKEGYRVLMTTNETLETLPAAVQDRIEVILMASVPHEDALALLPGPLADVTLAHYRSLPVPKLRLAPSLRRMLAFHRLTSAGIPPEVTASLVFGSCAAPELLSVLTTAGATHEA